MVLRAVNMFLWPSESFRRVVKIEGWQPGPVQQGLDVPGHMRSNASPVSVRSTSPGLPARLSDLGTGAQVILYIHLLHAGEMIDVAWL